MAQTSGTFPGLSAGGKKTIVQPMAPNFNAPKPAAPRVKAPAAPAKAAAPAHRGGNLGKYLHPPKGKK